MASNIPIIRQISWISFIPQIALVIFLIFIYSLLNLKDPALYGILTYSIISVSLKYFLIKSHTNGMKLVKLSKFEEAISKFENSYLYFTQNNWIDKYRFITLLSASKISYKEMALCNIAFCYSQIGNVKKVIEFYKKTLVDYPESKIAQTGLNAFIAIENYNND